MKKRQVMVFVHGLLGFERLNLAGFPIDYFRSIKECLADLPVDCHFPRLHAGATVVARACRLADYLAAFNSQHLCIVAHSRGGLDARYVATKLDPEYRIKQLITIGTPHRGSPLADWAMRNAGIMGLIGRTFLKPSIQEMTTTACHQFNQDIPNRDGVYYESYAGCRPLVEMPLLYRPWSKLIEAIAGENDGQVPVSSASWGEKNNIVRADHAELIGWNLGRSRQQIERPFNHRLFYRRIAETVINGAAS